MGSRSKPWSLSRRVSDEERREGEGLLRLYSQRRCFFTDLKITVNNIWREREGG